MPTGSRSAAARSQRNRVAPEITGRDEEMERLAALLATDGPGAIIVEGSAGVGKSRLLWELCEQTDSSWQVERIVGVPGLRVIPFGAVADLVPSELPGAPTSILAAVRSALLDRAGDRALLIAVDDAHDLDECTIGLLHQLVVRGEAKVALTLRSAGAAPASVLTLWKEGHAEILELAPLSEADTGVLAGSILGGATDPELRRAVWELSRGHPLYAVIALQTSVQAGDVVEAEGRWTMTGDLTPGRLTQLIGTRIGRLDEAARHALQVVAVGQPVRQHLLEPMLGDGALEALVTHGFVTITGPDGRAAAMTSHPLVAEVVVRGLDPGRRSEICNRLIDAFDPVPEHRHPDDDLRMALWTLDTDRPVDGALCINAGREALRRGDYQLAGRLARAALDVSPDSPRAGVLLARSLGSTGRPEEALAVLDVLHADTPQDEVDIALVRGHITAFILGRHDEASRILRRVADSLPTVLRWQLDTERSIYSAFAGDFSATIDAARAALDNPGTPSVSLATADVNLALAFSMRAEIDELTAMAERAEQAADRHRRDLPMAPDQVGLARVSGMAAAGAIEDMERRCARQVSAGVDDRSAPEPMWMAWYGIALGLRGRLEEAVAVLDRATTSFEVADPFRLKAQSVGLLVLHRAQTGGTAPDTAELLSRARKDAAGETRLSVWIERAAAWSLAWSDRRAAAMHACETGRSAISRDHLAWGAWALHDAVRWGHADLVADDLRAASTRATGATLIDVMAQHGQALHAEDVTELGAVWQRFSDLGSPILAAEASAQAARLARRQEPDGPGWRRTAVRARLLLDRCPGAMTPALADLPPGLSDRELEIASDASAGLASREISARRFLSVRTVDNHLHSVYGKLEVAGRNELADILGGPWR